MDPDSRSRHLLSYFYYTRDIHPLYKEITDTCKGWEPDFIADSGAFSALTLGKPVDLDAYADWLTHHSDILTAAFNLDVIGDARASAANYERLSRKLPPGFPLIPVFHVGSDFAVFEEMCRNHSYVGLGGLVGQKARRSSILKFLVHAGRIARAHGTALHTLGYVGTHLNQVGVYSCDSAAAMVCVISGKFLIYNPTRHYLQQISLRYAEDQHKAGRFLPAHGITFEHLTDPDFMRAASKRGSRNDRLLTIRAAGAGITWFENHLRSRHGVPAPATLTRCATPGTKVYRVDSTDLHTHAMARGWLHAQTRPAPAS